MLMLISESQCASMSCISRHAASMVSLRASPRASSASSKAASTASIYDRSENMAQNACVQSPRFHRSLGVQVHP